MTKFVAVVLAIFVALQLSAAPSLQTTTEKAQKALRAVTEGFDEPAAIQLLNALYEEGMQSIQAELQGKSLFPDTANPVMGYLSQMAALETLQNQTELHRTLAKVYRVFVELTWYQAWKKGGETESIPIFPATKDKALKCSDDMIGILERRRNAPDAEFEYRMAREAAKLLTPSENTWARFLDTAVAAISGAAVFNFEGVWISLKSMKNEVEKEGVEDWYLHNFFMRWMFVNVSKPQDLKNEKIHAILKSGVEKCLEEGREYAQGLLMTLMDIVENPHADPRLKEMAILGNKDIPGLISLFEKDDQGAIVTFCDKMGMGTFAQKLDRFRDARLLAQCFLKKIATHPKFSAYKGKSYAALQRRNVRLQKQHTERLQEEKWQVQASLEEIKTEMSQLAETEKALVADLLTKISQDDVAAPQGQMQTEKEKLEINKKLFVIFTEQAAAKLALAEKENHLHHFEKLAEAIESLDQEELQALEKTLKELNAK